ncbi:MAG: hypothetical protein GXO90_09905 [FCB group bacterium]|nr:hypothetical protein [FCB group bacterium]
MTETPLVLITDPLDPKGIQILENAGLKVGIFTDKTGPEYEAARSQASGWIVRSGTRLTEKELENAPALKVIGRAGVGVDNVDLEAATRRGIPVMNTPDVNTTSVAEHTIALMLALSRHIPQANASLMRGEWDRSRWIGTEIYGKTLGIIGLGKIGREVARRSEAFGMHLLGFDPFIQPSDLNNLNISLTNLETVFSDSDFITLHIPMNNRTRGLIGSAELKSMKPTCRLINVARGGIVDENALADALNSGIIAGAAIDVFENEPLARSHPLRGTDHCILTPHLGASTVEAKLAVSLQICAAIKKALLDKTFDHVVNPSVLT